jgi:hypothetical protein
MSNFQRYPMAMSHPGYRPAVLSKDEIVNGRIVKAPPGSPVKFPPVYVNNEDQEKEYAAQGYMPAGTPDPEAYRRAMTGNDEPVGHQHREYPRWMYQAHDSGEHAVAVGVDTVKVRGVLVKTEADRDALRGKWFETPMQAAEDELAVEDAPAPQEKAGKKAAA